MGGLKPKERERDKKHLESSDGGSSVAYECMRCGTRVTVEELSRLPEIKCICGFRVFRKARPPIVKQLKAV